MRLGLKLAQRARDDFALLSAEFAHPTRLATNALTATALTMMSAISSELAELPSKAPYNGLFDDAGVVQRSSDSLFEKAVDNIARNDGFVVRFVMAKSVPYGVSLEDYASELHAQWGIGSKDVVFVANPKLARAGSFIGTEVRKSLTKHIANSICNDTYALKSGQELYGGANMDVGSST